MDVIKRELDELPIVIETDIDDKTISKMILDSPDGTVFVVDENSVFKGIITEGDYIRYIEDENNSLKVNTNCKFVYDNQDTMKEIAFIHMEYKNIRTIPVLDRDKKIVCAYSLELDYTKSYYGIFNKLYKMKVNKMIGIYEYLIESNCTNVALWGANELSMIIGDELTRYSDINRVYVCDNINNIENFKFNVFEFGVELYWLNSIYELLEDKNIDIIVVTELSFKNRFKLCKDSRIVFIDEFVQDLFKIAKETVINFKACFTQKIIEKCCNNLFKQGINCLCVSVPNLSSIFNLRESTKFNVQEIESNGIKENNMKFIYNEFGDKYALEFYNCFSKMSQMTRKKDIFCRTDYYSKYINCIDGRRIVISQPEIYDNTIYILGSCIANSHYAEDKYTIGNILQQMLLKLKHNLIYRVVPICGGGGEYWRYTLNWLNHLELKKKDIIVFLDEELYMPFFALDLTEPFNKLYQQEDFFLDIPAHCNHKGYKIIAEEIFRYLNENYFNEKESEVCCKKEKIRLDMDSGKVDKSSKKIFENNRELIKYLEYIDKQKVRGGGIEK